MNLGQRVNGGVQGQVVVDFRVDECKYTAYTWMYLYKAPVHRRALPGPRYSANGPCRMAISYRQE